HHLPKSTKGIPDTTNHPTRTGKNSQPCHRDKKLALTNKHTVEFSNNRHTPTQHHPTGQNLAWGNFSNLPDPLRPLQLGDSSGGSRGTSSPDHVTAREAPSHSRGGPPGGPATVSCDR